MTTRQRMGGASAAAALLAAAGAACGQAPIEPGPGPFPDHVMVTVKTPTVRDLSRALALADAVWSCEPRVGPDGGVEIQVSRDKLAALDALGLAWGELIPDVGAALRSERERIEALRGVDGLGWFENYKTYAEFRAFFEAMAASRPELVSPVFVAGLSLEGRDIFGVRITGPEQPGNPRAGRPQILFNGGQHAREWANPATTAFIADQLVDRYATDPAVRALVDRVEFIIVPIVNPDGYVFSWASSNNRLWRKNRRNNGNGTFGVDLNRNWGYEWGGLGASTSPGNDTYRGPSAFSEPETRVLRDLIIASPRLRASIDFHTFSELILSPWGYTDALPPQAELFNTLNLGLQRAIAQRDGVTYLAGPAYTTIYPASGVMPDWVFGDRGVVSWTIELRDAGQYAFVLPPEFIVPTAAENFPVVHTLGQYALSGLAVALPGDPPAVLAPQTPTDVDVRVTPGSGAAVASVRLVARATRTPGFGPVTQVEMSPVGGGVYRASLPPAACGGLVEYWVEATPTAGPAARFPADGSVLSARVQASAVTLDDTMETDRGWTGSAPGDTATAGFWARCAPNTTGAQAARDVTPGAGRLAWITDCRGGSITAGDVDGGGTTLTSPRFSAVSAALPGARAELTYWRWYSNNRGTLPGTNSMPVLISSDDGATWSQLELVTENANRWVRRVVDLSAAGVPLTDRMRLRFVARDTNGAAVEAGVDEVSVRLSVCLCPGDLNADGVADFNDLLEFLNLYNAGSGQADFNNDATIDFNDLLEYLNVYNGGC